MSASADIEIKVQCIRGLPFPKGTRFTKANIESAIEYKAKDGDVIVSSYPKTGSTWLQYMVWHILNKDDSYSSDNDFETFMPFLEIVGAQAVDNLPSPRTYKTHLPFHLINLNKNAKYIYIHRNPKDTVVSYFHFLSKLNETEYKFDYFFESFLNGSIWYGDYIDHVLSFYEHRHDDNVLFLSYEKLLENRREGLLKIAQFLGKDYHYLLMTDENLVQKILNVTSFDYMKKNLVLKRPSEKPSEKGKMVNVEFFRKGIIGDGKSLSPRHSQLILEKTLRKTEGTELKELWTSYY